ncbi:hypothetical protein B0T19DRAFT_405813 [Cercophora scortea]|uniref:Uncharacterized protein n=1 Tax=Cercophora scortea TaxID=314031 RepID=A0AAE0MJT5_9PEZI|nr:hypothetical protein B0T19DRAFT_405813 [Cercophora scortea]
MALLAPYAKWLIAIHSLSLALCVAIIALSGYATSFGFGYGAAMASIYVAAIWTLIVDVAEISAIATSRLARLSELHLCLLELVTAAISFLFPLFLYGVGSSPSACPKDVPISNCQNEDIVRKAQLRVNFALILAMAAGACHFVCFVFACISYSAKRKADKKEGPEPES